MSLRTLRRRVVVLETRIIDTLPGARLTPAEIADITRRLYAGESVTPDEMTGLKRHGRIHAPLMDVWFVGGQLMVKRVMADWDDF